MHEVTVAENIVKIALNVMKEHSLKKINKINIKVGKMSCINEESLQFAFEILAKESGLEDVDLHIIRENELFDIYVESIEGEK
ncbi:hydrogenase maturation nickel metallochaperone HypA [Candidatus Calescamantes bacterium]|nr:hydrogenase maturation nickel metallochaperone HypA [Candidatus Calescamantes bacterium]